VTSVLVVGAGSIGSRHARNLAHAGATVRVTDVDAARAQAAAGSSAVPFDDPWDGYDGIVIATPTTLHIAHATTALATGARVLVEKPLSTTVDEGRQLADHEDRVMVGFNLRLHEPVERVMKTVRSGRVGGVQSARLWFGSWLPDWRPGTDYRSTYSAQREAGGGVLLDAIHELDLLVWLAGDARFDVVGSMVERVGPLEIDVEDTVRALLRHADGWVAEIALDYLSRRYRRGIEVIGETGTVRFDWARAMVEIEDANGVCSQPATTPVDESYEHEARRFLAFVDRGERPPVTASEGLASVALADAIRAAA
jgi:predicted dehydrogenase